MSIMVCTIKLGLYVFNKIKDKHSKIITNNGKITINIAIFGTINVAN